MSEKLIQQKIFRALGSRRDVKLFRNNTGTAFMGKAVTIRQPGAIMLQPGDVVIRGARRVKFGLHIGSSDLIGFKTVKITADMVGQLFARFLAVEVKTAKGRASADQLNFIEVVNSSGGQAGIARSEVGATELIGGDEWH